MRYFISVFIGGQYETLPEEVCNLTQMNRIFGEHMSIMTSFSYAKFTAKYFTLIY